MCKCVWCDEAINNAPVYVAGEPMHLGCYQDMNESVEMPTDPLADWMDDEDCDVRFNSESIEYYRQHGLLGDSLIGQFDE